jgi:hypothetical protein
VYGTQERHAEIRRDVCEYMLASNNPARFKWLVDPPTDAGLRQYVSARRHPVVNGIGEWGDHAEIIVMEELFDRPIEIFSVKVSRVEGVSVDTS